MIGRILSNRYEILEKVGGGGMALVYRANDLLLHRIVAVKVLSPHYTADDDFVAKFRREAQAAAGLSHPNIVGIFDVGQDGDTYYIVMEFLQGKTLKAILSEQGPLPVDTVLQIGYQIADALRVAHRHGVIHRDIKPHNIMITADGLVKVTDFGIARAASSATLTHSGSIVGSVHYISPEQARGGFVGERSDLYSLGVVLYELLTGEVPFQGDSMFSIVLKHLQEAPAPLRQVNPRVPAEVERIVMKLLAKDQSSRYQSASELMDHLQGALREVDKPDNLHHLVAGQADDRNVRRRPNSAAEAEAAALEKTLGESRERTPRRTSRRQGPRPWWHYAGAATGVVALTALIFLVWFFWPKPEVVVPDVVGKLLTQAQAELQAKDLNYVIVSQQYDELEPNAVISQNPVAGRTVRAGRTIELVISRGPEYADVPDVVGVSLRQAIITLENAGFTVAQPVNRAYDDEAPVDEVLEQNPVANTKLRRSTPIILTVSDGPAPQPVTMPSLLGLTPAAAQQRLADLGLILGEVENQTADSVVIQQSPEPGATTQSGSSVDLVFGPQLIQEIVEYTVPNGGNNRNREIEIYTEDINGTRLAFSTRAKPGETVRQRVTGSGFLKVTIRDDGETVKEEVFP